MKYPKGVHGFSIPVQRRAAIPHPTSPQTTTSTPEDDEFGLCNIGKIIYTDIREVEMGPSLCNTSIFTQEGYNTKVRSNLTRDLWLGLTQNVTLKTPLTLEYKKRSIMCKHKVHSSDTRLGLTPRIQFEYDIQWRDFCPPSNHPA